MKRMIWMLTCVLMCMLSMTALAEYTMQAADAERIVLGLPEGIMLKSKAVKDGEIHIVIDTYKTDWNKVATIARKSSSLVINPGIKRPDEARRAKSYVDYAWFENRPLEVSERETTALLTANYFNNGGSGEYIYHDQGLAIGRFDEGTGLFVPEIPPAKAGDGFAVCWKMNDGTLKCERVRIRFEFTDLEPIYVKRHHAAAKYMVANAGNNGNVKSVEMKDGFVEYRMKNEANAGEVQTAVAAPSWLKVEENWTANLLDRGSKTALQIHSDGKYGLKNNYVILTHNPEKKNMLYKKDWAIEWVDDEGNVAAAFCLEGRFYVGEPELSSAYVEGAEPLPAASVTWSTKNPIDGLGASYDEKNGLFYLSVDEKALPANRKTDLDETTVSVLITPPGNAVQYNLYGLQGDVIYGDGDQPQPWSNAPVDIRPGEKIALEDLTELIYFREISASLANGKTMSYYFSPARWGDLGGVTLMLEWIDGSGKTISRQHLTVMADSYKIESMIIKNQSLARSLDKFITEPEVLAGADDVYLVTSVIPQMGDHVIRYEIALEYEDGEKVELEAGDSVLLYLPYPDGKSADQFSLDEFVVYHYLPDGGHEEYSVANGKLIATEFGLCMEVSSFSPYTIHWETAPDTSELPQTGDRSNLALWLLMAAGAMAAGMSLKKKKAA